MKAKIFIDGEHGTTGLQIITRLTQRNDIDLLSIAHEDRRNPDTRKDKLREADIAILCLPDDAAREAVALASDAGTRFIDASEGFFFRSGGRIRTQYTYKRYGNV